VFRGPSEVAVHDKAISTAKLRKTLAAHRPPRGQSAVHVVTEPDEMVRCGVAIEGIRCDQPTAFRVEGADQAWDDYMYVCRGHLHLVQRPGDHVVPIV
jgi:hypothetical protein